MMVEGEIVDLDAIIAEEERGVEILSYCMGIGHHTRERKRLQARIDELEKQLHDRQFVLVNWGEGDVLIIRTMSKM